MTKGIQSRPAKNEGNDQMAERGKRAAHDVGYNGSHQGYNGGHYQGGSHNFGSVQNYGGHHFQGGSHNFGSQYYNTNHGNQYNVNVGSSVVPGVHGIVDKVVNNPRIHGTINNV